MIFYRGIRIKKWFITYGRNIPITNIIDLLDYTLLPHEAQIPEPRRLDLYIKGLVEVGINKTLIENEYLLTKLAKEEHKTPESQSDDQSDSSGVESDNSDDKKESVNESIQSDSDEEMESNSEKVTCHRCEKDKMFVVRFYWDKDDHCTICDEASTLGYSHLLFSAIHVRAEFHTASPEKQSLHQMRKLAGRVRKQKRLCMNNF